MKVSGRGTKYFKTFKMKLKMRDINCKFRMPILKTSAKKSRTSSRQIHFSKNEIPIIFGAKIQNFVQRQTLSLRLKITQNVAFEF